MFSIPFRLIFIVLFDDGTGLEARFAQPFVTHQECMAAREQLVPPLKLKLEKEPLFKDHIELIDGLCIREDEYNKMEEEFKKKNDAIKEQDAQPKIKI